MQTCVCRSPPGGCQHSWPVNHARTSRQFLGTSHSEIEEQSVRFESLSKEF